MTEEMYSDSKGKYVKQIFKKIAPGYEFVNRIISLGLIHKWRKEMVKMAAPEKETEILDLCTGTGKVAELLAERVPAGRITGVDFSPEMIRIARDKVQSRFGARVDFKLGNALELSFADNSFDYVFVAFGLRNVEDLNRALEEMKRVVRPGGTVIAMDLGKTNKFIFSSLYYLYFNHLLPLVGGIVCGQKEAYSYLSDSLKTYPDQEAMKQLFLKKGFVDVSYRELTGGVVVVHQGKKR